MDKTPEENGQAVVDAIVGNTKKDLTSNGLDANIKPEGNATGDNNSKAKADKKPAKTISEPKVSDSNGSPNGKPDNGENKPEGAIKLKSKKTPEQVKGEDVNLYEKHIGLDEFSDVFGKKFASKKEAIDEFKNFKSNSIFSKHDIVKKVHDLFEKGGNMDDFKNLIGLTTKDYSAFKEGEGYLISDEDVVRDNMGKRYKNLTKEKIEEYIEDKKDSVEFSIEADKIRNSLISEQKKAEEDFFGKLDNKQNQHKNNAKMDKEALDAYHRDIDKYVETIADFEGIPVDEEVSKGFSDFMKTKDWDKKLFLTEDFKELDKDLLFKMYIHKYTDLNENVKESLLAKGKKEVYNRNRNYDPTPDRNRNNGAESKTEGDKISDWIDNKKKENGYAFSH